MHGLSKTLDDMSKNVILFGEFNIEPEETNLLNFLNTYQLKKKTFFKNPDRPIFIDLILTNSYSSFQDTCTVENGFLDFEIFIVTVVKQYSPSSSPQNLNIQIFKGFKRFQNDSIRSDPEYELSKFDVCSL